MYTRGRAHERSAYMHKRGARGAAANRNAVIMDAVPATVVHHEARGDGIRGSRGGKERIANKRRGEELGFGIPF